MASVCDFAATDTNTGTCTLVTGSTTICAVASACLCPSPVEVKEGHCYKNPEVGDALVVIKFCASSDASTIACFCGDDFTEV